MQFCLTAKLKIVSPMKRKTSNPMEIFLSLDIGKVIIEELKRTCPEEFKKLEEEQKVGKSNGYKNKNND